MNSSRVVSNNSSELLFDLTQDSGLPHYQGGPAVSITGWFQHFFKKLEKENLVNMHMKFTFCFEVLAFMLSFSHIVRYNGTNSS